MDSGYQLAVAFDNRTDKTMEIDQVTVSATYPTGKVRYEAPVAGRRIDPRKFEDELPTLVIPDSVTEVAPSEFLIWEFRYHTADHPECASS